MKTCNYYVTLRCNDTCEFCPIWQDENLKKIEEKSFGLNQLKKLNVSTLNITGGEPLLRIDLPQILKQAKETGFKVNLTTNGILLGEKVGLLGGLVDGLMVSLDYPTAEMHDRSRGVECFNEVIDGIKLAKNSGLAPIINFTMTRDSVLYLPEMIDLAETLRVFIQLLPVYDNFGTQGFAEETIKHIKYYSRRRNVLLNLALLDLVKNKGNKTLWPRCRASQTTVTILPDGRQVSPCFFNQEGREGRADICSSCMRFSYMLPSFSHGFDKYYWLNKYSNYLNRRKMK
ncbi:MAG: radical SAM protein [bacterium]|nr:radical SAM protein [Candidatus Margulisiibacteriota bacterium]